MLVYFVFVILSIYHDEIKHVKMLVIEKKF